MTKATKSRGPKEAALRAKREEKAGDIPDFLKRTETPEQAEARRAKQAKAEERKRFGDSKGLMVRKPPEPVDPKIAKAIARDLKSDEEAGGDAAMARAIASAKPAKAKKLSPLLKRAVALRDNLTATAMRDNPPPPVKPPIKVAGPDLGDGPGLARLRNSPNAEKLRKENEMSQKKATKVSAATGKAEGHGKAAGKSIAIGNGSKKKPEKKAAKPRGLQISDSAVITVLAKENPKRGKGGKRFALYRSGMTFAKYVEAQKGNQSQARGDVLFDLSREWIKVSPAPKAA